MSVTLPGIIIDVSPVHLSNAELPMDVTLLPMVTDVSPVQSRNA